MTYDGTRLTLITAAPSKTPIDWKAVGPGTRLALVGSITALRIALEFAVAEIGLDVERVIVDRTGDMDDFLRLLARIPKGFTGEALCLREDGTGCVSVTAYGGERVLYSLSAEQLHRYLAANVLVNRQERFIA